MSARYTLIVGTKDWSSWSLRPYVALRAVGAPFEESLIRLRQELLTGNEIIAEVCREIRARQLVGVGSDAPVRT